MFRKCLIHLWALSVVLRLATVFLSPSRLCQWLNHVLPNADSWVILSDDTTQSSLTDSPKKPECVLLICLYISFHDDGSSVIPTQQKKWKEILQHHWKFWKMPQGNPHSFWDIYQHQVSQFCMKQQQCHFHVTHKHARSPP